jgi:hypothetical protein
VPTMLVIARKKLYDGMHPRAKSGQIREYWTEEIWRKQRWKEGREGAYSLIQGEGHPDVLLQQPIRPEVLEVALRIRKERARKRPEVRQQRGPGGLVGDTGSRQRPNSLSITNPSRLNNRSRWSRKRGHEPLCRPRGSRCGGVPSSRAAASALCPPRSLWHPERHQAWLPYRRRQCRMRWGLSG